MNDVAAICRRAPLLVVATVALLVGGLPADSRAATAHTLVSGERHWALYDAAPGEDNRLSVSVSTNSRLVRFSDEGANINPGPGCASLSANTVDCRIEHLRVRLVQVQLGDLADTANAFTLNTKAAQVNIVGGLGDDVLRGSGPTRFNFGGQEGDDGLIGSRGPDVLIGGPGNDRLSGRWGDDLLFGRAGADVLRGRVGVDRLFGGSGGDKLGADELPPAQDAVVSCGPGVDVAIEDSVDLPKTVGCERIKTR